MNILILDYLLHFPDITGSSMLETKLANYLNYYEFQVHKYWGGEKFHQRYCNCCMKEEHQLFHQHQLVTNNDVQKLLVTIDVLIV